MFFWEPGQDKLLNRPDRKAVPPIVVVLRIDATRTEVQVVGIGSRVEP
jgi:hypothetical protein